MQCKDSHMNLLIHFWSILFAIQPDPIVVYTDASVANVFNLDEHCESDVCIGAVIPFKNEVYSDAHLKHLIGYIQGHCIAVADYHEPKLYCVYSFSIDHVGVIAVQGTKTLTDPTTLLITGASGDYKGLKGSLTFTPTMNDKHEDIFKYYIFFKHSPKWEEKPYVDWKVSWSKWTSYCWIYYFTHD